MENTCDGTVVSLLTTTFLSLKLEVQRNTQQRQEIFVEREDPDKQMVLQMTISLVQFNDRQNG
jgi:hypothetical protein